MPGAVTNSCAFSVPSQWPAELPDESTPLGHDGADVTAAQFGETSLDQVARRVGVDPRYLRELNPQIQYPSALNIGDQIHLPKCSVQAGANGDDARPIPAPINVSPHVTPPGMDHVIVRAAEDPAAVGSARTIASNASAPVVKLGPGALQGVREATLVGHGTIRMVDGLVQLNGQLVTPEGAAQALVRAGWKGGTMKLVVCQTGMPACGGGDTIAQRMANEFQRLDAPTKVVGVEGNAIASPKINGGATSVIKLDSDFNRVAVLPKGKGFVEAVADPSIVRGSSGVAVPREPVVHPAMAGAAGAMSAVTNVLGTVGMAKFAHDFLTAPVSVERQGVPAAWVPRGAEDAFLKSGRLKEGDMFIMFAPDGSSAAEVYYVRDGKAQASGAIWDSDKGAFVHENDLA